MTSSHTVIGRIGEFFAAFVLEKYGVECHHVDRQGSDLWCKVRESIVTVEVKTATRIREGGGGPSKRVPRYNYNTRPTSDADWYCFVALDEELMLMRPASAVTTKHTALAPELFTVEAQEQSIEEFLRSC